MWTAIDAMLPALPANPFHQRRTVETLLRLILAAVQLPACPEPHGRSSRRS